tara:strand:- start:216 stop:470 length:255 start_codon:yes stop_codon:yes gene_type:complete
MNTYKLSVTLTNRKDYLIEAKTKDEALAFYDKNQFEPKLAEKIVRMDGGSYKINDVVQVTVPQGEDANGNKWIRYHDMKIVESN